MGYGLYNGNSEGFESLTDGYVDYAKEIIAKRSIPDLRDGLKPVNRRILYAIKKNIKNDGFSKSVTLVGEVVKIHPHGDASVYGTLCSMTDSNGSLNVPFFATNGNFGRVYSSDTPSASRYTKAMLNKNADDMFYDMEACEMVPAEEGDGLEPAVLPVRYPICLINGTSGMAVSVATEIPCFNFHDVVNLTIKGLKNGFDSLKVPDDTILPDFPVGGILVRDDAELAKIMTVGKGRLKVRAKVDIQGKEILVREVPYGRTCEGIMKMIDTMDIYSISDVRNTQGFKSKALVTITCKNKKIVEDVLVELYRRRVLQNSVSVNMMFINDGKPGQKGVFTVLKEWSKWREQVCIKKFKKCIADIDAELPVLDYFMRLINNKEWRDRYVDIAIHENKNKATGYLKEIMPDITRDACDWISERRISAFNDGGKYAKRYNDLTSTKKTYESYLADIDSYIVSDLEKLLKEKKGMFERKTEATYKDYKFSVSKSEEAEDESPCYYAYREDGFMLKLSSLDGVNKEDFLYIFPGFANSVLIGFDIIGRALRIYGSDFSYNSPESHGSYLPKYLGVVDAISDDNVLKDYKIMYLGILDGKTRMLLYKDGFIGFVNTSEFDGKKRSKIVFNGVDPRVGSQLLEVFEEDEMPKYLMVADDHGNTTKFGLTDVSQVLVKGRTTRTRVWRGENINCNYYAKLEYRDILIHLKNANYFMGAVKCPKPDSFNNVDALLEKFVLGKFAKE